MKKLLLQDSGGNVLVLQKNENEKGTGMHIIVSRIENLSSMKDKSCVVHLTLDDCTELINGLRRLQYELTKSK